MISYSVQPRPSWICLDISSRIVLLSKYTVFVPMLVSTNPIGSLSGAVTVSCVRPFLSFGFGEGGILFSFSTLRVTVDFVGVFDASGFALAQKYLHCCSDCRGILCFLRWFSVNNKEEPSVIMNFSAHNASWSIDFSNTFKWSSCFFVVSKGHK